ncbi:MAG: type VI secretion system protein TssA [Pseudomonadota bacterium]
MKQLVDDTAPGNAEVSSEPAYMEMQVALEGKAGSQMGDAVIAAQPPNFKKASELCVELLSQSRHLSLMVALSRAASGIHGFQGLADALTLMHEVCTAQWQDIHPAEDKDDPDDPWWERINLLRELTDNPAIAEHLYTLELVSVRHLGAFSKRDIDIASGRRDASDEEKERCNISIIRGAFAETDEASLAQTEASLVQVVSACDKLDVLFADKIGEGVPTFERIKSLVDECGEVFREYAGDKLVQPEPEPEPQIDEVNVEAAVTESEAPTDDTSGGGQVYTVVSTAFADRDAVAVAFDDVIRFYQQYEPSSPVPILLIRARQMVYKNFFDILRELAPQHKDNFRELMNTLRDDPLSFLLEHSYNSFLNGEKFELPANPAVASVVEDPMHGTESPASMSDQATSGITSRGQVLQTLKDIKKFFEVQEPSSPVPLIVQRVIALVPKTFLDLLAEFEVTNNENQEESA